MVEGRPITVVVPVYGDLPSLLRCVNALMETVDTHRDTVLLVNDCGPEVESIERELLALVGEKPGFRYERNARNLGFVGTCNRAALELDTSGNDVLLLNSDTVPTAGWIDELREVLHADELHGIVCARSTNATIASLPFRLRDPRAPRTLERSATVSNVVGPRLPRYSYPPVAMGFCFLVRRELIDRFGLFDEAFAPGYGEENDFCLRMAREGYRSVMAHRALVAHEGARSFLSARRARLRYEHEKLLVKRHPDYSARVREYLWSGVDPVDAFADVLVGETAERSAAIFADRVADVPASVIAHLADHVALSVVTSRPASRRWRERFPSVEWLLFGVEDGRVWDAAICPDDARPSMRLRAAHAAPRQLIASDPELVKKLSTPVVDTELRTQWRANAAEMTRVGIPRAPRPSVRSRTRAVAERFLPVVVTARQRWMSRRR